MKNDHYLEDSNYMMTIKAYVCGPLNFVSLKTAEGSN